MYTNSHENAAAITLVSEIIGKRCKLPTPSTVSSTYSERSTDRVAHNMAMRFKDTKFTGNADQIIQEYLRKNEQAATEYSLPDSDMLQYRRNLFESPADSFFYSKVLPDTSFYLEEKELLTEEYHSHVK